MLKAYGPPSFIFIDPHTLLKSVFYICENIDMSAWLLNQRIEIFAWLV